MTQCQDEASNRNKCHYAQPWTRTMSPCCRCTSNIVPLVALCSATLECCRRSNRGWRPASSCVVHVRMRMHELPQLISIVFFVCIMQIPVPVRSVCISSGHPNAGTSLQKAEGVLADAALEDFQRKLPHWWQKAADNQEDRRSFCMCGLC